MARSALGLVDVGGSVKAAEPPDAVKFLGGYITLVCDALQGQ
jgi:hypothetical protein